MGVPFTSQFLYGTPQSRDAVARSRRLRASAANGVHGPRWRDEPCTVDLVPRPFISDVRTDQRSDIIVACAPAQQRLHIGLLNREQAVTQLAVGSEPDAVAVQAKRP